MTDLFNYERRATHEVQVGATPMGAANPIRIQSMTNTPTRDTEASVAQAKRIIDAGGEYVRLTTQGVAEAENLRNINAALRSQGYLTPLVADVHFNPKVAEVAALYAEKVRINPGNYVDAARTFKHLEYTDEEYARELEKIRARFVPLLDICKANHTALRIGVNHGSLSDRIMSRYGDTPEGMVESCMEFLRICVEENFRDVVVSIKASNTVVMVKTVRLMAAVMEREGMDFPLHLGVTEAGDGEDGRIKSALGIGALLADGLGDTIRVSLSEEPEAEIPVARKLVDHVLARQGHPYIPGQAPASFDYLSPVRRHTRAVGNIGGENVPVVIAEGIVERTEVNPQFQPDYIYAARALPEKREACGYILDADCWSGEVGESSLCFTGSHPLRDVLGIRTEEADVMPDYVRNHVVWGDKKYSITDICALVHAESAEVLGVYEKDFYAGYPALTVNTYGKGKAYFIASENEQTFYGDFLRSLAAETGIACTLRVSGDLPHGVTVNERKREEGKDAAEDGGAGSSLWFVQNFNGQETKLTFDDSYRDIETGKEMAGEIVLKPWQCLILEKKR